MSVEKHLLKVFLCHASADKPKVWELYRYLRKRGIKPWFDEVDLIGGQDWQVEIPKAIASSDAIIVCLTKNSVDKEGYVQKEIRFALDKALEVPEGRIYLIPVRFEECDVPRSLSRYQWIDLFEKINFTKLMKSLRTRATQLERATVQVPKPDETTPNLTTALGQEISKDATPVGNNILAQSPKEKNLDKKQDFLAQGFRRNWIAISLVVLIILACIFCAFLIGTSLVTKLLSHTPTPTITTTSTHTAIPIESKTPNLLIIQTSSVTLTQESTTTLTRVPTNTLLIPTYTPIAVPTNTSPVHITIPTDTPFVPTSAPTNTLSLPTWTFTSVPTTFSPQNYPTTFKDPMVGLPVCTPYFIVTVGDSNGITSVMFYWKNGNEIDYRDQVMNLDSGDSYAGTWKTINVPVNGYPNSGVYYVPVRFTATDILGNTTQFDTVFGFGSPCP